MNKKALIVFFAITFLLISSFVVMAGAQQEKAAEGKIVYGGWLREWDGVELVLSSHQGPSTDAYEVISKEFEELTGAKVQVLGESWKDLLGKHLAAASAQTPSYDIITFPYIWFGHYVEGDIIEDLNDWFAKENLADPNYGMDDIIPAILEAYGRYRTGFYEDPDALWSLPYKFDVYLSQYRTDLFGQAGLEAVETWSELKTAAEKLEQATDTTPLTFPLSVDDPMAATFVPLIASYGGDIPNPWYGENLYPKFHEQPGIDAANYLNDVYSYMPKDVLNFDYDRVNTFMSQGRTAYALNWNAYLPVLVDPDKSTITEDVAFDLTPAGPNGRPQGLGGWQMSIYKYSRNKEAAFQLMQFLTGQEKAVDLALAGGSVARFSVAENDQVVDKYPFYPLLVEAMENVAIRGQDRGWTDVQRIVAIALNDILMGDPVEESLVDAAAKVFDAAQQIGYTPEETGPRPE